MTKSTLDAIETKAMIDARCDYLIKYIDSALVTTKRKRKKTIMQRFLSIFK